MVSFFQFPVALSREFPRVNPIRALLAEAADDENFNRFIVLPHLDELRSAVSRVEGLIEDARIMIEQPQPLKELSAAYSLLYRYGVGESEPVFSTLRQRHLEGVAWQESARKHVPPVPIATEASAPQVIGNAEAMLLSLPPPPPPSQQRRLPGLEKIANLVDQKSDPESSLAMVIFDELEALEKALTAGRSWQTRARAALDRLDEMEEKENAQKVEGSADNMSLSTISAEQDALLVELACLLLEGRALPLRISEKEELETRYVDALYMIAIHVVPFSFDDVRSQYLGSGVGGSCALCSASVHAARPAVCLVPRAACLSIRRHYCS
jgi:hypothetical protein